MKCKICGHESAYVFDALVLRKYEVAYFQCGHCGFVQTEDPYWLEEAYRDPINLTDTGIIRRNVLGAKSVAAILYFLFDTKGRYLDYAGGFGLFTRLMRDYGFDFYTCDPHTPNLLARGFDFQGPGNVELVTNFECFEHFRDPIPEIEKMLAISDNIFFSTHFVPDPLPKPWEWWYYAPEHGQHIALYSSKSMDFIAHKYGLRVYSLKGYHLLTPRKIPPLYFQLLAGAGRYGLGSMVKSVMKSKIWEDNHLLSLRHGRSI